MDLNETSNRYQTLVSCNLSTFFCIDFYGNSLIRYSLNFLIEIGEIGLYRLKFYGSKFSELVS